MPSMRTILTVSLVTMAVMWGMNQAAAISPAARKLIKGSPVAAAGNSGSVTAWV